MLFEGKRQRKQRKTKNGKENNEKQSMAKNGKEWQRKIKKSNIIKNQKWK